MRLVLPALAFSSSILLAPAMARADCGCSGNPGTLESDSSGPCLRYPAPSGATNDITFRFAEAYSCGAYATGEFFVVTKGGVAEITGISPNAVGGRHGVDVNPSPDGPQRWDDRLDDYASPIALPYKASNGSSVVKYVSDNPGGDCDGASDEKSCGRFAAVVTVVDAAPADPAATFRPPFVGKNKPLFFTRQLQTQLLSRLIASSCRPPTLATALAWSRHLRLDYTSHSVTCDLMSPEDALPEGRPWSTDIWAHDTDVYAWLHLANVCATAPCTPEQDLIAKLPVLVGYVQHGIDVWAVDKLGASLFRGGGGNGGGKLFAYAFAAAMLADPALQADLRAIDPEHFFESASYYAGQSGVALWGQPTGSEKEYWADFSERSTRTIRDPYGLIDGGFEPGAWYQDNTAKPTQYSALLMRLMPSLQNVWPVNGNVILAYADRWVEHGALTAPDPCAPVVGKYATDYGPSDDGRCIPGSGRVPALDGSNKNGGNRQREMGECMWKAFRSCAETCSCEGQSCEAPNETGSGGMGATSAGGMTGIAGSVTGLAGNGGFAGATDKGDSGSTVGSPRTDDGHGCGCSAGKAPVGALPALIALCAVLAGRASRRRRGFGLSTPLLTCAAPRSTTSLTSAATATASQTRQYCAPLPSAPVLRLDVRRGSGATDANRAEDVPCEPLAADDEATRIIPLRARREEN
jgi:hypothetical protein